MSANAGVGPDFKVRLGRAILVLAALAAGGTAVWALLRFVVTDEQLLLDYLRVLIWPFVVAMVLYWLRAPLREKFGQLLRVEGFGASAQFSAEAQAQRLTDDLSPDLVALFEQGLASEEMEERPLEPAENEDQSAQRPTGSESDSATVPETTGAQLSGVPPERSFPLREAAAQDEPVPEESRPTTLPVTEDQLVELARAVGMSKSAVSRMRNSLRSPENLSLVLDLMAQEVRQSRALRNAAVHNTQQSRDSIEGVIRKSAAWGYDMGRAGAPRTVPDVEWNADGTWKITTEVPAPKASHVPETRTSDSDRVRQIKSLEDEIKKLEREKHSPIASVGMSALGNSGWLMELKRKLRAIDPGNPWGIP